MDDIEDFLNNPTRIIYTASEDRKKAKTDKVIERERLINNPHSYIRENVRTQVQDCLWMVNLRAHVALLEERAIYRSKTLNRCIICTLPLGENILLLTAGKIFQYFYYYE